MAALDEQRPDAAIIDATLPKVSGLALARQFIGFGIPSLIISGDPTQQERLAGIDCHFLAKPFRMDQLLSETKALIEEAEQRMARLKSDLERLANAR
jgi:DNA-binding response OmpR family regulator